MSIAPTLVAELLKDISSENAQIRREIVCHVANNVANIANRMVEFFINS